MIQNNISMPHPVLGIRDDFMEGSFSTVCKIQVDKENRLYRFEQIEVEISNNYIKALYEEGKLDMVFKISCTPTYKTWTYTNPKNISIPENEIDIFLEADSFLVTSKKLKNFSDKTFNDDFDNKSFALEKGDIVAVTGSRKIPIRKENEKVSLGSIFRFSKITADSKTQELYFDFDDDQIVIHYPAGKGDYDPITLLFDKVQGMPYTALNLYIIPALTEAYRIMLDQNENSSSKDKKWFAVLESLLPKPEWDDEPYINAQKVISTGLPISMAFDEIIRFKNL